MPPGRHVPLAFVPPWLNPPGRLVPLPFGDNQAPPPVPPPPPPPPVKPKIYAGAGLPWGHVPPRHCLRLLVTGSGRSVPVLRDAIWSQAPRMDAAPLLMRWGRVPVAGVSYGLRWRRDQALVWGSLALRWGMLPVAHSTARLLWSGRMQRADVVAAIPWLAPQLRTARVQIAWGSARPSGVSMPLRWDYSPLCAQRPVLPWGHAGSVRWFINSPGPQPPDPSPPWVYRPPPGYRVRLDFLCPWPRAVGNLVRLDFSRGGCYRGWGKPRRYIVLNTAIVVRLPERTPIPVTAGSIRSSRDKSTRDIALTLADPAALDLLRPDSSGPKSVEINLNGHVFTGIIEAWDDNRRHPGDGGDGRAVSVSGRSRVALLSEPYAPRRAHVEPSGRHAQQLIDAELELTGFTADVPQGWSWAVPGGVWAYDGKTRLAAIEAVAGAAGAVVIAHPWDDVLRVRPLYPVSPWDWATALPDVQIHDDLILQHTRSAGTGARGVESVSIPLWPPAAVDKPRLVEPLDLVELIEPSPRRAQAAAVELMFATERSGNGAHVLVVEQRITLDPAPAEPIYNQVLVSGTQVGVSDPVIRTGTAGDVRLPNIIDPLITEHAVARERGRNALAAGTADRAASNLWRSLRGLDQTAPQRKGNVIAIGADGGYTIATADGATLRARALPGVTWNVGEGVFIRDGVIVDSAPSLPGIVQNV